MNLSNLIKSGPMNRPQRGIIYGIEGVGKTSLAAQMPVPIILDTESGSHQYNCHRITVSSYQELETAIDALSKERNDYKTIVIDTIDWAEKYLIAKLCKSKGVDSIGGFPHGRGYTLLRDSFDKFLCQLMEFIEIGKHVILIGHAQVKGVQLPGLEQFDRYELKLDRCNSDSATEWCDFQLFLNFETRTIETKDGNIKAVGGKERFLYPVHAIGYDAKNHCGLTEPLKCEYAAIAPLFSNAAPLQQQLADALYGIHQDWITKFLIDRQKIVEGESIMDLPDEYCAPALAHISKFRGATFEFGKATDNVQM